MTDERLLSVIDKHINRYAYRDPLTQLKRQVLLNLREELKGMIDNDREARVRRGKMVAGHTP